MRLKSNSCEQGWGDASRIGTFQAKHQHKAQANRQHKAQAQMGAFYVIDQIFGKFFC